MVRYATVFSKNDIYLLLIDKIIMKKSMNFYKQEWDRELFHEGEILTSDFWLPHQIVFLNYHETKKNMYEAVSLKGKKYFLGHKKELLDYRYRSSTINDF